MSAIVGLSPAWRRWVVENLLRGAEVPPLVDALLAHGAERELATREVAIIAETLALLPADRRLERRLTLAARLVGEREVARLERLEPSTFHRDFHLANRPALLPGLVAAWAAHPQWDFPALADRFGGVEVAFCAGRAADPRCDANYREHTVVAPFRDFLARVASAAPGNDLYLISRNRAVRDTPLSALLDTLDPLPPVLVRDRMRASSALWIGPAGTVTPMHHDWNDALFFQLRGRKRVRLVSPREPLLHREIDTVYSGFDPEHPDPERFPGCDELPMLDVVLGPGDALFLPAGWWHHVLALDTSISVSCAAFPWPNDASWYRPGAC